MITGKKEQILENIKRKINQKREDKGGVKGNEGIDQECVGESG